MEDCIFCKIVSFELPAHVVRETDDLIVFLSLEGHPLVVPKGHFENIFALDNQIASKIMQEAVLISKVLKSTLDCDGINLIQSNGSAAGQDVFHFHLHIKPRWFNDDVVLSWNTSAVENEKKVALAENLSKLLS